MNIINRFNEEKKIKNKTIFVSIEVYDANDLQNFEKFLAEK